MLHRGFFAGVTHRATPSKPTRTSRRSR
jgi:hypothetical protein